MCPLRIILIFLSATLAGFFVLRNLNSQPEFDDNSNSNSKSNSSTNAESINADSDSCSRSTKVISAISSGFWTCVDMASGRYLWRNLVAAKRSD